MSAGNAGSRCELRRPSRTRAAQERARRLRANLRDIF
jgi:hypothetical protein